MSLTKRNIDKFGYLREFDNFDEYMYYKSQEIEYKEIPYLERLRAEDRKLKEAIEASTRASVRCDDKAS